MESASRSRGGASAARANRAARDVMTESNRMLTGHVAVVTGASSGIGRACAIALGRAGAAVVVNHYRDAAHAAEVVATIEREGSRAIAIEANVADESQVRPMFASAIERLGTVHILVNNAGIQRDHAFPEMPLEAWREVLDVNLTGQFLCAREAVREFLRRGVQRELSPAAGKIICMSSVHQAIPWALHANYAVSKGGIHMLVMTLAQELAPKRIRVNGIAPGAIQTPINRAAWETEAALLALLKLIPYGRIGEPEDVARAVLWLASDESDYVTGATLTVDGGMLLYPAFGAGGG
jgi:glucose 1-dehydrogenase